MYHNLISGIILKILIIEKKKVLTAKTYKDNIYCDEVIIKDDNGKEVARLVYTPDKPLSCGAKVFIIADSKNVETIGGEQYESK